jgi:sulfide dehydrogenase cytochrome subunit
MPLYHRALPRTLLLALFLFSVQAGAADVATTAKQCEGCHGKDGVSDSDDVPTIAGISSGVQGDYLLGYQEKSRPCPKSKFRHGDTSQPETDMCTVAGKLSADDVDAIASHFAGKSFVAAKQSFDAQKAAAGEKIHARDCAKCHSKGGRDPADDASILGGQHLKYLQQAFADFKSGKRPQSKKMAEKMKALSDADYEALANYYASLQ